MRTSPDEMFGSIPQLLLHPYETNIYSTETGNILISENHYCGFNDLEDDLRGFVDNLDVKGRNLLKSFLTKSEKDVSTETERMFTETLHDFKGRLSVSDFFSRFHAKFNLGKVNDQTSVQRGVNRYFSRSDEEEMKHKLERFKVKTVNITGVGVVKEEKR